MKLSIVIPVYNEAGPLRSCLQAIAAQTVQPFEVVVVDNNCTDDSVAVAGEFSFARVVSEKQQGVMFARNTGFDAARGEIIGRIDADTLLPTDWVAHVMAFFENSDGSRAFSGGAHFYNVRLPRAVSWLYNFLAFDFNHLLIGHPTLWGSNMAVTAKQWRAVRKKVHSQTGIHEDLDLAMHLHDAGYRISYDRHFPIRAHMRRVRSNRHELWEYLQWWPRTLRLHGKKTWVPCWLVGCLLLYLLTPFLTVSEYLSRAIGRKPLYE